MILVGESTGCDVVGGVLTCHKVRLEYGSMIHKVLLYIFRVTTSSSGNNQFCRYSVWRGFEIQVLRPCCLP